MKSGKWHWMMDFCKERSIPPAQSWAWNQAEEAYTSFNQEQEKSIKWSLEKKNEEGYHAIPSPS